MAYKASSEFYWQTSGGTAFQLEPFARGGESEKERTMRAEHEEDQTRRADWALAGDHTKPHVDDESYLAVIKASPVPVTSSRIAKTRWGVAGYSITVNEVVVEYLDNRLSADIIVSTDQKTGKKVYFFPQE